MSRREVKDIIDHMPDYAGEDGARLARTIITTFAGVGRGISAKAVVRKLADSVTLGEIAIDRGTWVYTDHKGRRRTLGAYGDNLLPDIVEVANLLHEKPFARHHRRMIAPWELADGILQSSRLVERELARRRRVEKFRNFFRPFFSARKKSTHV